MDQVKDPVCGMMVDPETAPARTTYESQDVYFCSEACKKEFEKEPARYTEALGRLKFGSAGSGGLEYEGAPPRRNRN